MVPRNVDHLRGIWITGTYGAGKSLLARLITHKLIDVEELGTSYSSEEVRFLAKITGYKWNWPIIHYPKDANKWWDSYK